MVVRKGSRVDISAMMMTRMTLPCFVIILMLSSAKQFANAAGAWCYHDDSCDPTTWAGECQTGKQQSPIDFNNKNTKRATTAIRLRFNKAYSDVQDDFKIKNNGHTIQIQLGDDLTSDLVFDGDYMKSSYRFSQLHFHWGSHDNVGSEHTVNGVGYVAELHLVHFSNDYNSLAEAVATKNRRGLAVLGIFFQISDRENYALQPIIDAISKVDEPLGKLVNVEVPLNISALLPDDLALWRYYGSLTTPSCNEVVHWTVFKKPMPISRRQWQQFKDAKGSGEHALVDNNRPTQPTINRQVLLFDQVFRERMPEVGEADRNPPAADTYFDRAQKDIESKTGDRAEESEKTNNGANSTYGSIIDSAITGFLFLSVILQIVLTSLLKCQ